MRLLYPNAIKYFCIFIYTTYILKVWNCHVIHIEMKDIKNQK